MSQTQEERLRKVEELRASGLNPYPYRFERTHSAEEIHAAFDELAESPDGEAPQVAVAGRIMTRRRHGRVSFMDLMDQSGKIQVYLQRDLVGDRLWEVYQLLDLGDFLGVRGTVFRTRTGEITVRIRELEVLSKALRVLPDKWHGLKDVELRYRQRYLDLVMNEEVRKVFMTRTRILDQIRQVFNSKGGIEVETPTLQPIYGGASARPFKTHHNALNTEFYLRIADELYLKRLIVGGFDCVYEICKDFRNEGMDRNHNPEFTMAEIYWAYRDYNDMMDLTEELFVSIARNVVGSFEIEYQGTRIDLSPPWPRRPMLELIREHAGVDVAGLDDDGLRAAVRRIYAESLEGEDLQKAQADLGDLNRGNLIEELFDRRVEMHLVQPTFVTDYPKETSPLAKIHRDDPTLTERFELFIDAREMANAFSELNDPVDQRQRFEAQMRYLAAGDAEAQPLDEDFLRALEYGMPPCGGLGIGVDRLTMLFTDQSTIQEVILFPQMRPEKWIVEFQNLVKSKP